MDRMPSIDLLQATEQCKPDAVHVQPSIIIHEYKSRYKCMTTLFYALKWPAHCCNLSFKVSQIHRTILTNFGSMILDSELVPTAWFFE